MDLMRTGRQDLMKAYEKRSGQNCVMETKQSGRNLLEKSASGHYGNTQRNNDPRQAAQTVLGRITSNDSRPRGIVETGACTIGLWK